MLNTEATKKLSEWMRDHGAKVEEAVAMILPVVEENYRAGYQQCGQRVVQHLREVQAKATTFIDCDGIIQTIEKNCQLGGQNGN